MNQNETPLLLAIDTSTDICSIVISNENKIFIHYLINIKRLHDKLLAEITRRALNDMDISLSSIDAVAISSGPGSFTGLRIGASFAKALCIDESPKLISVPTLFAYSVAAEEFAHLLNFNKIHALITANSGIVYHQIFDSNSQKISEPEMLQMKDVISNLALINNQNNNNELFIGNALLSIENTNFVKYSELNFMDAIKISKAGWRLFNQHSFIDPSTFEPEYIQDFLPK
ncbi:MAG: tRNA (adenosine(37)-N6)-threonylcarbamoyltransferase complex dimerization subunit type 1 TsaB [Chloroherpetonaceae bacterium]